MRSTLRLFRRLLAASLPSLLAVALLTAGTATAANAGGKASFYEQILPQFMCTACHEPLGEVASPEALSEQAYLRSLVDKGLTLSQIKAAMESQYGVLVLAKPPANGFNLVLYVLPPLLVLAAVAILIYTLPKWRRRSREAAGRTLAGAAPLKEQEAERLDAELDQFI